MLILDGYSRRVTIGGSHFIYRPALASERRYIRYAVKFADDNSGAEIMSEWMASKIEFWSGHSGDYKSLLLGLWKNAPRVFGRLCLVIQGVVKDASRETWRNVEKPWRMNLREGIDLEINHPKVANRSCDHCQKYWYSEETGRVLLKNSTGEPLLRSGLTICRTPAGCPKGTPENQRTLNKANRWALQHFMDCDAVGEFPDDPIVRRNAKIIRTAIESIRKPARK